METMLTDAPTMTIPEPASSAHASIVALRGVRKTFPNGVVALDGFDLAVRPGELLTLLGPSGCGKSTALRIVAGLSGPDRGTVAWSDAERPDRPAAAKRGGRSPR